MSARRTAIWPFSARSICRKAWNLRSDWPSGAARRARPPNCCKPWRRHLPSQRAKFIEQWQAQRFRTARGPAGPRRALVRASECVLLAHEDKTFPGAFVASLSIPWGEIKDDRDRAAITSSGPRHGPDCDCAAGLRPDRIAAAGR